MRGRPTLVALAAVALALIAAAPAQAAPPKDRIVISGVVDVRAGQSVSDVVIADGPVAMGGRVSGNLVAFHGTVFINGPVHGDVVVFQSNAVRLGPRARIGGDLAYRGSKPARADAVVAGDVHKVNIEKATGPFGVIGVVAFWLAVSISTLVFGLLLLWLAPRAADATYEVASSAVGPAIGWGFGLLIGLPILAVVALVTLVGIPFGIALLLALFPIYELGYTTGAWLLGRRLVGPPRGRFLAFLAGWGILRVAAIVPVLGGLVWLAATVFGLGVLLVAAWRARGPRAAAPAPA
jgi:cytoskeletal protein CcmA (bactofilin family)